MIDPEVPKPIVDVIDSLIVGFITPERARDIVLEYPIVYPSIAGWIRDSAAQGNWRRVVSLANLAAPLDPPGLGEVLRDLVERDIVELNNEDIVDILGEINAVEAAGSVFRLMERRVESDSPAFWLLQKGIMSLGDFGTAEAKEYLWAMTGTDWPDVVRWHAAVELQVEDDLGFDEDEMLKDS